MIAQKDNKIEELQNSIHEDENIADDENEQPAIGERARERIIENHEQIDALQNERELEEGTSLGERVRNILKKYGFTVSAVGMTVSALTI